MVRFQNEASHCARSEVEGDTIEIVLDLASILIRAVRERDGSGIVIHRHRRGNGKIYRVAHGRHIARRRCDVCEADSAIAVALNGENLNGHLRALRVKEGEFMNGGIREGHIDLRDIGAAPP